MEESGSGAVQIMTDPDRGDKKTYGSGFGSTINPGSNNEISHLPLHIKHYTPIFRRRL